MKTVTLTNVPVGVGKTPEGLVQIAIQVNAEELIVVPLDDEGAKTIGKMLLAPSLLPVSGKPNGGGPLA